MLCLYGYSHQQLDGLSFPEDVVEPDVGQVARVTLEVMSLRMELDMLIKVGLCAAVMHHACHSMHPACNILNAFYFCALNTCTNN